jgi:hypothetical protein
MSQPIFADGIADIMVVGGVVRIEFFTLVREGEAPISGEQPNMTRKPAFTVTMPLPGFGGSLSLLEDVKNKMLAEGVLKARSDADQPTPEITLKKRSSFS